MDSKQMMIGFCSIIAVSVAVAWYLPAYPQPIEYHDFADRRELLNIANFWNVVSNLPFIIVGYLGLRDINRGDIQQYPSALKLNYQCFFIGIAAVGIGSIYYHLQPDNNTLVWDRLPMTIAFMAFFSLIIGEQINITLGEELLLPLVGLGAATVFYWAISETANYGDLRPYGLIQFVPMLLIPYILLTTPARYSHQNHIWAMLMAYFIAKIFEAMDAEVLAAGQLMGGHAVKHFFAAGGPYLFYLCLQRRQIIDRRKREDI